MNPTNILRDLGDGGTVLCLGAHSDDIEIGCGGTLAKLFADARNLTVTWVVFTASGMRENEARVSAARYLHNVKDQNVIIRNFRNGFFPYEGAKVKDCFESLKDTPSPDVIFTHYRKDLHQDHRVISDLTWNTFRNHQIFEYEIPKYDADLGSPNAFVTLDDAQLTEKVAHLDTYFPSQADKQWFSADAFRSLSRIRGIQCNSPGGFAEGFYVRKLIVG